MASTSKGARRRSSKKGSTRKGASKRAGSAASKPRAAKGTPTEQLARKIVRIRGGPSTRAIEALYSPDCYSVDASGEITMGRDALAQKLAPLDDQIRTQRWTARSTFVKGTAICIEWAAEIELRDGRQVTLDQVELYRARAGKVVEERLYGNPAVLEVPDTPTRAPLGATTQPDGPDRSRTAPVIAGLDEPPPIDPLDL